MRRLSALLAAMVVVCFATAGSAQTSCAAPTIVQTGGTNPVCAGQPVTLDAGGGWVTYQWSNGATTRSITDAPSSATTYTVTVTDANGCSVTSTPLTIDVDPVPSPPINAPSSMCAGGSGNASVFGGGFATYSWSAQWAVIDGPSNLPYVSFHSVGNSPVQLTVDVVASNGCAGRGSVAIPITGGQAPQLNAPATICQSATGIANVTFISSNVNWSVTNGDLVGSSHTSQVHFRPNSLNPVTLTVTGLSSTGCQVMATATVSVIPAPTAPAIALDATPLCPGSPDTATINGNWGSISWTVSNGATLVSGQSTRTISFTSDPGGLPAFLSVRVTDPNTGCAATSSVSVPVRSIPQATLSLDTPTLCPGASDFASLPAPAEGSWSDIRWSITNGTLVSQPPYPGYPLTMMAFTSDPNGQPATITADATDNFGCHTSATATVPVRSIPAPTLLLDMPTLCPGAYDFASISAPAQGVWSDVQWTITNGTIVSPPPYPGYPMTSIAFTSDPGGAPVTLTATATDNSFCHATATATVPVRSIPQATLLLDMPTLCPGAYDFASISAPAEGSWSDVRWTITNGTIVSPPPYPGYPMTSIAFTSDPGGAPVTLTATATDNSFCHTTATTTIPVRSIPPPTLSLDMPALCPGAYDFASVSAPAQGTWSDVQWSITNGALLSPPVPGYPATSMAFTSDPNGQPVTLTATVTDNSFCHATASITVPVRSIQPPAISLDQPSMCPGSYNFGVVANPPQGSWSDVQWSITNGTLLYPPFPGYPPTSMAFISDPNGLPVTLTATVTDNSFCHATSSVTIPATNLAAPDIVVDHTPLCSSPNSQNTASVDSFFTTVDWSVTNATIISTNGNQVVFHADATGDVTITATVHSGGCTATATKTVPVAVSPSLPITVSPNPVCTTPGPAMASIQLPQDGSIHIVSWSVTHGYTMSYQDNQQTIAFFADGTGDPVVTAELANQNGCIFTSTVTVPLAAVEPPVITGADTICPGAHGTLTLQNASSYASHRWYASNGSIIGADDGPTVEFVPGAGNPTIYVGADVAPAEGCHASGGKIITIAPVTAGINAGGPTTFCAGGSVTLSGYGADGGTYLWSNGATTQSITVTQSGSYTVTTTNSFGCARTSAAVNVNVTALPDTTITASGPTSFCPGGSVTLTAAAGASSYLWSNGATTQSITVTDSGNYSVTVTNAGGCSATSAATTVTVNALPDATITASGPIVFCDGGSVTLSAPAGMASYLWSTGATTRSITVSSGQAPYTVTTTNASGCSTTSAQTWVWVNPLPNVVITPSGPTNICQGDSVTLTAPFGGTSYLWSNGATTRSITVTQAGSYSVTMTESSGGCSNTSQPAVVTVNAKPDATITASGSTMLCAGASVTLSAPAGGTSYLWSNGATTQSITVNQPDTYSVTVTNASGCSATRSQVVRASQLTATITADGPTTFCYGNDVKLTASPGVSYLWSDGHTTPYIYAFESGSYSVTVTDAYGCSVTSAPTVVTANPNPQIVFDSGSSAVFCSNENRTITATVMYAASYSWSTGETTATIHPTQSGTYTLTAVSAAGCTVARSVAVTILDVPKPVIVADAPTPFCGQLPIHVDIPHSDAMYPVQIDWLTDGAFFGQSGTTYTSWRSETLTVQVRFNTGCSITSDPLTITRLPDAVVTIASSVPKLCPNGTATLTAQGAPSGTTYLWSTGETTPSITVNAAGTYSVTTTSSAGCPYQAIYTLTADPIAKPVITAGGSTTLCAGASVTLTAPSGAISYLWSTGATTRSISVAQPGSYSVAITNANGCSATSDPVTVINDPTAVTISGGPATLCPGGSIHLTSSVANGTAASYQWYGSGGQAIGGATSPALDITPSSSGSYYLRIVDGNGCTVQSNTFTYTVDAPSATITASGPQVFCPGDSVTFTANSGASYLWSNGATTRSITVSTAGAFNVTVTDAAGCSATSGYTTTALRTPPTATIAALGPTTFCPGGSVTLNASLAASYLWSNGATTQSITVSAAGSYSVTVTNSEGCSATSAPVAISINTPPPTPVITPSGPTTFCDGYSVTLTAPNGYTYLWSTGATTQSIHVTAAGSYSVTVTDANGCSATSAPTVVTVNPNPPVVTISPSGPTTFCAGGSVTLTAPAGYSGYLWSTGATTQSIVVTSSGSFSVGVTNASGCSTTSASTTVTVNANPSTPVITANGPTTFCAGASVTLTAPASASYLWSNGATTQAINVTTSGTYSVTVTNASGCSATSASTTVTVNATPSTPIITAGGPTTFCAGGSVTLNAPASASYLWSNGATTQAINVTTSGTYSVTVTNASGCSATSASTSVTVNANPSTPIITAGGPTTFCAGGSVTLTAPASASYLWSNGATTQAINVTASGSYSVTITNTSGCSATSASTSVTVNATPSTPIITAGGPTTFCDGGSVTLTAPASASYLWTNGATTQAINVTASGTYSVTVTNASGCSTTSASTTVTVNASPSTIITANGPTTFCAGGSVTLTAPASASYLWSNGATTQSINVTTSGTYSVTVTNASGCSATSASTTVTVNARPATPVITPSGSTAICPGSSVTLTAPASTSYLWSTGATTQSINVTAAGSYSVTVTNASGCSATSAASAVTLKTTTSLTQPSNQTIPRNTSTTLSVTASGTNLTYQWYSGNAGNTATPLGTSSSQTVGPLTKKGPNPFWVRVTGDCGTASSSTITVQVN